MKKASITELQFVVLPVLLEMPAHFCRASQVNGSHSWEDCHAVCCCVCEQLTSTMTALYHMLWTNECPVTHATQRLPCFIVISAELNYW